MQAGLLSGVRVLEVATVISGPYAGMVLSDLGAEVTKVEPLDGDPFRVWGRRPAVRSAFFEALNRGKQSVCLDLKSTDGKKVFSDMCAVSDVVLENFRPGALDRLGLGYDVLRRRNEGLIYCSISGFGNEGPYAAKPAYDAVVQAVSGFWSQLAEKDSPEAIGPPMIDQVSGLFAALAIAAAIAGRHVTGRGQRLSVSMLEAALAFQPLAIADYLENEYISDSRSRAYSSQSYGLRTRDGQAVAIHLSSRDKFWRGLLAAIDRQDLGEDPRFATVADRVSRYGELQEVLSKEFARHSRDEILASLEANDVPCGPINDIAEALREPQVAALEALRAFGEDGDVRHYVVAPGTPRKSEGRRAAPQCGTDSEPWLRRIGYSDSEIDRLRTSGNVGQRT